MPTPKDPWPLDDDLPRPSDEQRQVRRWRYKEARAAGLSIAEAELFADSQADIAELRQLVAGGCTPDLIARIIL